MALCAVNKYVNPRMYSTMFSEKYSGFPRQILSCRSLRILMLNHQQIRGVPDEIRRLRKLDKLGVGDNDSLESLSASVGQLRLSSKH